MYLLEKYCVKNGGKWGKIKIKFLSLHKKSIFAFMRTFSGTYHSKLDRGRCFFPAPLRKYLPDTDKLNFKARVSERNTQYIEIYEESDWQERIDDYKQAFNYKPFDDDSEDALTDYLKDAKDVEMEMKNAVSSNNIGRMLIPKDLLDDAKIGNEITIIGTYGMLQLWDSKAYANRPQPAKTLKERMEALKQKKNNVQ